MTDDVDVAVDSITSIGSIAMLGLTAGLTMKLYADLMNNMSKLPAQDTLKQRPLFQEPRNKPHRKKWVKNAITNKDGSPKTRYLQLRPLKRDTWFL